MRADHYPGQPQVARVSGHVGRRSKDHHVHRLEEAEGGAAFIAKALGDIARAKGMTQVARDAGLSRESLYKALSGNRSPGFDTILKVVGALGLQLHAGAARDSLVHPVAPADPRGSSAH